MKVSLNWIRELCGGAFDADTAARRLTMAGLEVEGRHVFGNFAGVVVARVVGKRPHPDAAKLTLVDVDAGDGQGKPTQVVCGASNVPDAGGLVCWARPGARVPMGEGGALVTLGEKAVRGIVSPGMLCAEDELGLGTSHAGILILDGSFAPGQDLAHALGLPDEIWELNVTPNRPDWLGHIGVARELTALSDLPLKTDVSVLGYKTDIDVTLERAPIAIDDAEGCPRLASLAIDGVTVRPSPLAIRLRLQSLGVRAISNVVDATNLLLLGFGQPLHAYDRDKLRGGGIRARRARPGESIVTLDEQTRALTAEDLVIADEAGAVGIAGVMGGAGSEVATGTTRLLLEAAHFSPGAVRRTARRLGLHTEAAHRFERGTDPALPPLVVERLAGLIVSLAGGKVTSALTDVVARPIAPAQVTLRPARTQMIIGAPIDRARQKSLLQSIGLDVLDEGESLRCIVPTFRPDLTREIDLVEEIARLHGYENIPATLPRLHAAPGPLRAADELRLDATRDALRALGLDELMTYSFVAPSQLGRLAHHEAAPGEPLKLHNPMGEERSVLRTSLVPGLTAALARNLDRGVAEVRGFEVGAVFLPRASAAEGPLPVERWHAAAILYGRAAGQGDAWLKPGAPLDFFDVKGVVEELGAALGVTLTFSPPSSPRAWLHPKVQAEVRAANADSGALVGAVGELHPSFAQAYAIAPAPGLRPLAFELDLQALPPPAPLRAHELPRFPSVTRDVSFLVDAGVTAADIRAAIDEVAEPLRFDVRVLEDYRDARLPPGKKGMLWSIVYRAPDRTLTDDDVQRAHAPLVARLTERLSLTLR